MSIEVQTEQDEFMQQTIFESTPSESEEHSIKMIKVPIVRME